MGTEGLKNNPSVPIIRPPLSRGLYLALYDLVNYESNILKKYIYIILFFAVVTNLDVVADFVGYSDNEYTIGNYTGDTWYSGHLGYNDAIKTSDLYEAPAIIYMYTDWCKYCKKFESILLTNSDVNSKLSQFVKIKINPEIRKQDKALYKKLNGKGYPTLMFKYGAAGKLVRVRAPYTKKANGWQLMTSNEFIDVLNKYGS